MSNPASHHPSKQIIEAFPEYFFIYDIEKKAITYLSDSFSKFRISKPEGTDLEQMRNLIDEASYPVFDKIFTDLNHHHYLQDKELQVNDSNEEERWVNIKTYPIISEHTKLIAGHVQYLSHKIKDYKDVKKEVVDLEQIIHMMAHDLRGPLGTILNITEIQCNSLKEKDCKNAELYTGMTARIVKEVMGTLTEITNMLELKSERFRPEKSTVNIKSFLHPLVEHYSIDMKYKGIEFYTSLPDHDVYAELDPLKFRLVIQNLLTNSIKFTEAGGKVTLAVKEEEDEVIFSVSDTGLE